MAKPQGWGSNLGIGGWDEKELPWVVLNFRGRKFLRGVDCNNWNFYDIVISCIEI